MKIKTNTRRLVLIIIAAVFLGVSLSWSASSKSSQPLRGQGRAASAKGDQQAPPNVSIHAGFTIRPLVMGLDFPTAIAFSETRIWVGESGFMPPLIPRIKEIDANGNANTILSATDLPEGKLLGPITGLTFHKDQLWITHRQVGVHRWFVGAISRFNPDDPVGSFTTVLTNLPSAGDHYTEEIRFSPFGRAFFSQGTATNSSVVGPDSQLISMWLANFPHSMIFHRRRLC